MWYLIVLSVQNIQNPLLSVQFIIVCIAISLRMIDLGSNDGSLDQIRSDQSLSHVRLFSTPWIAAHQASLSITNSRSSSRLTSIESVMPSSHLILCRPFLLLPPIPPSIRVFYNESTLRMRWLKYWSFSFSIIPSKEHPGLISFRMGWLDLLAVQWTLDYTEWSKPERKTPVQNTNTYIWNLERW